MCHLFNLKDDLVGTRLKCTTKPTTTLPTTPSTWWPQSGYVLFEVSSAFRVLIQESDDLGSSHPLPEWV